MHLGGRGGQGGAGGRPRSPRQTAREILGLDEAAFASSGDENRVVCLLRWNVLLRGAGYLCLIVLFSVSGHPWFITSSSSILISILYVPCLCFSPALIPLGYVDLKAETAFAAVLATVSLMRRLLYRRHLVSHEVPQQQQPTHNNLPAAAADSTTPISGVQTTEDIRRCSVSVGCNDEETLEYLREAAPLMAGICGVPPECLLIYTAKQQQQGRAAIKPEGHRVSSLSRIVCLPETTNSEAAASRAVALDVAVSSFSRDSSSPSSGVHTPQIIPTTSCRRRASLQRKICDLKRRMEMPE